MYWRTPQPEGELNPIKDRVEVLRLTLNPSGSSVPEYRPRGRGQFATNLIVADVSQLARDSISGSGSVWYITLVLVGVADSVDQLIAEHQSIERALVQIHMPRMSNDELTEIVDKGLNQAGMTIAEDIKRSIASLSQGLPSCTHLLTLHAALIATDNDRTNITQDDLTQGVADAVANQQQSVVNAYEKATHSPRENLYRQVLLACALADTNELGYFSAADVREPMRQITHKNYEIPAFSQHLNDFCEEYRGPILQKTGTKRRFRFRFTNPLVEQFVVIKGIADGMITRDQTSLKKTTAS